MAKSISIQRSNARNLENATENVATLSSEQRYIKLKQNSKQKENEDNVYPARIGNIYILVILKHLVRSVSY